MPTFELRPYLGRLRTSILAIVAGVGFVVHGGIPRPGGALVEPGPTGDAVHATRDVLAASARPAAGLVLTSLLPGIEEGRSRGRADDGPVPRRSLVAGSATLPDARVRAITGPRHRSGFAREALARAGRLSAPALAPPLPTS